LKLRHGDELTPQVGATLEGALARVHSVPPDVEMHHVDALEEIHAGSIGMAIRRESR
jgi:hypothetical protein